MAAGSGISSYTSVPEPELEEEEGMNARSRSVFAVSLVFLCAAPASAKGQERVPERPEDTEFWQPVPPVVTPGPLPAPIPPPSDALILFDGTNLHEWVNARDGSDAGWVVSGGVLTVDKAAGDIQTRRHFKDYQLHIEWRIPDDITGSGQARGNSGLYMAKPEGESQGYELQILDSFGNETYVNGMAGSIYKQSIPLVNPSRRPGEWQTYDVIWTAPAFGPNGSLEKPARVTAFFNGVLVQNDVELRGDTRYIGLPQYIAHGEAPILLQAHGDPSSPISFRNIWVRELK